jgi:putative beta-lysine N-acetyltransferase
MMKPSDSVITYGKSLLQHGTFNNRVYIITLAEDDLPGIIGFADDLAETKGYTKIIGKIPTSAGELFSQAGYIIEASIPEFYQGKEEAVFMAKYTDPSRRENSESTKHADTLAAVQNHTNHRKEAYLPEGFTLRPARTDDAEYLADLFQRVFPTYPFPIFDSEYLKKSMQDNVRYFLIMQGEKIAASSACEVDEVSLTVEMTDFATDPMYRGRGFAGILLDEMEKAMRKEGILTGYTIARSVSLPMNAVFAGAGYRFGGMLPNNTNISGSIENMNIWYKKL